ncbi:MAG: sulfite exporter TauE/SafE family protein [Anaerolineaceae bacterium]|nr:MAG: sulfite exporter TauE/SafE family protein [Anaerolineaceae bacterium]
MDISVYLLVFFIILSSSFIHSSAAFGFSVFSMTLLPLLLPLITSAAIVKVALLTITIMMVMDLWKHINFRFIIVPVCFSLLGNSLGFYLLMTVDSEILKRILGGVLVITGVFMFLTKGKLKMKKTIAAGIGMGLLSGLAGGMFNLSGVVLVIYYYSVIEDKLEYAASLQATFVVTAVYGIILNMFYGNFSAPGVPGLAVITIVAVIIGCYLGLKVLRKINKQMIGNLSYIYMIIMGIVMAINIKDLIS